MSKFQYIDNQIDVAKIVSKALRSDKKYVLLQSPTGSGKSGIAYLAHEITKLFNDGITTNVMMHQKVLQDQYEELFSEKTITIKGKDNYSCFLIPDILVGEAACQFTGRCMTRGLCTYYVKKAALETHPFIVTNYQLVFAMLDTEEPIARRSIGVFDEAHNLEDIVTDYYKLTLSTIEIDEMSKAVDILKYNKMDYEVKLIEGIRKCIYTFSSKLDSDTELTNIFDLTKDLLVRLDEAIGDSDHAEHLVRINKDLVIAISKLATFFERCCRQYSNFMAYKNQVRFVKDSYYDEDKDGWSHDIAPLTIDLMFSDLLMNICDKAIFMSALLIDPFDFCKRLGLNIDDCEIINLGSMFKPENRPVIMIPIEYVNNSKMNNPKELENYFKAILGICVKHGELGQSGVIFTSSYKLSEIINLAIGADLRRSGFIVLLNKSSESRSDVLESFRDTSLGKRILISPSFFEGVNLENDISRFQIIAKVPYMSMASEFVSAKMAADPKWYELSALKKIINACGRSVRHKDDSAVSYIVDGNAIRLYNKYKKYLPVWFTEVVQIHNK